MSELKSSEQCASQVAGSISLGADDKPWNDLRPDAQGFDEVRIVTVPRYKQSGLSGDEWRISASIQLWRKGKLIHERGVRNVEIGCAFASAVLYEAQDDGKAHFGGDGIHCDQEGCADAATVATRPSRSDRLTGISATNTRRVGTAGWMTRTRTILRSRCCDRPAVQGTAVN